MIGMTLTWHGKSNIARGCGDVWSRQLWMKLVELH